jgi:hypothetical protein
MFSIVAAILLFTSAVLGAPAPQVRAGEAASSSAQPETAEQQTALAAYEKCRSTQNTEVAISDVRVTDETFAFTLRSQNLAYAVPCTFDRQGVDLKNANLVFRADGPNGGDVKLVSFDVDTGAIALQQLWSCVSPNGNDG